MAISQAARQLRPRKKKSSIQGGSVTDIQLYKLQLFGKVPVPSATCPCLSCIMLLANVPSQELDHEPWTIFKDETLKQNLELMKEFTSEAAPEIATAKHCHDSGASRCSWIVRGF